MPSTPKCNCNIYKDHIVIHESHCNIQKKSTQPWEEVKSCEYINEDSLKEKFGEFLEKHYPQSLWGIINFFPIQDFIKELLSSERAKLLEEVGEKMPTKKNPSWGEASNGFNDCLSEVKSLLNSLK